MARRQDKQEKNKKKGGDQKAAPKKKGAVKRPRNKGSVKKAAERAMRLAPDSAQGSFETKVPHTVDRGPVKLVRVVLMGDLFGQHMAQNAEAVVETFTLKVGDTTWIVDESTFMKENRQRPKNLAGLKVAILESLKDTGTYYIVSAQMGTPRAVSILEFVKDVSQSARVFAGCKLDDEQYTLTMDRPAVGRKVQVAGTWYEVIRETNNSRSFVHLVKDAEKVFFLGPERTAPAPTPPQQVAKKEPDASTKQEQEPILVPALERKLHAVPNPDHEVEVPSEIRAIKRNLAKAETLLEEHRTDLADAKAQIRDAEKALEQAQAKKAQADIQVSRREQLIQILQEDLAEAEMRAAKAASSSEQSA